jgi:erythromycin esterase-like protein
MTSIDQLSEHNAFIIGESSHGAHEFAKKKFELTEQLFPSINFIVVEWDWCDCFVFNLYVKGYLDQLDFSVSRWPEFMWRNQETFNFLRKLRNYNQSRRNQIGFYGMDAFGLKNALKNFDINIPVCLNDQNNSNECKRMIKNQNFRNFNYNSSDSELNDQVCRMIIDRELNREDGWDSRENHMLEVIKLLKNKYGDKYVVLCHNTHAQNNSCLVNGPSSIASRMNDVYRIGMICDEGSILTADNWGEKPIVRRLQKSREGSYESEIFGMIKRDNFEISRNELNRMKNKIKANCYRALGAIVSSSGEGYYFDNADLICSFDVIICFRRVTPIHSLL